MNNEKKVKEISRKDFIKGVGKSVAGVALLGGVSGILTACGDATANVEVQSTVIDRPEWPFPYKKLDADKAAQRAYDGYKTGAG